MMSRAVQDFVNKKNVEVIINNESLESSSPSGASSIKRDNKSNNYF